MRDACRLGVHVGVVALLLTACGSGEDDIFAGGGGNGSGGLSGEGPGGIGGGASGGAGASALGGGGAGTGGSGASPATGGTGASAGGGSGGAVTLPVPDSGTCASGSKACGGICVPLDPFVGCGNDSCAPCPTPPGSVGVCNGEACGFECFARYERVGDHCVAGDGGVLGEDSGVVGVGGGGGILDCPAAEPATGDICVALPFPCTYGAVSCACLAGVLIPFWFCQ